MTPLDGASALHTLLSPDGYYLYLNVPRPPPPPPGSATAARYRAGGGNGGGDADDVDDGGVDVDLVRKHYRRLSLRHHPDRRTGDAETFRVLNRAKRVLTNPKLRRQYDLLGLDLDDEDDDGDHRGGVDGDEDKKNGGGEGDEAGRGEPDNVVSHMASATLATILQVAIRTLMMGAVATFVSRFKITVALASCALLFISYRVRDQIIKTPGIEAGNREIVSPLIICAGIVTMHRGGTWGAIDATAADYEGATPWSWTYWLGESLVMAVFLSNSFPQQNNKVASSVGFLLLSVLISLILRGKFWRYALLVGLEAAAAFSAMLIFPVMEMILEEVVNEKMRKVGEKVRAHAKRAETYAREEAKSKTEGSMSR